MKTRFFLISFFLIVLGFFYKFILHGLLPIPSDTIVGLYYPYRDLFAAQYPHGIPFFNFMITDPIRQQYPWKFLSIQLLQNFQLPLWNPYDLSGYPLFANLQSAALYPLNIIFFFMPFDLAWSILIIMQPILAGMFMFAFLKNLKLNNLSSFFGAITFAFCGFFVSWMEWGNVVQTGLWLPLLLLCVDKFFDNVQKKTITYNKKFFYWNVLFIFGLVASFLAGHLQVFFYESIVVYVYFFFRWLVHKRSFPLLIQFFVLSIIALILASLQIIPLFQFIQLSARDIDQISSANPGWFLPYQNLTQFIAPDFFGNPATLNYWGIWNYGEFVGYIGIVSLVFALFAIFFRRGKTTWFFIGVCIISLLFALPTIIGKVPFKFAFPFVSTSQPTRLLYLVDFSSSVLSAFGFQLFQSIHSKKKILLPLGLIAIVLVGFWLFVLFNYSFPQQLQTSITNINVTKSNLKLPTILFVIITVVFFVSLVIKKQKIQNAVVAILILIAILDLFRFTSKYTTFAKSNYLYPQTKVISFLQHQPGIFRVMETDPEILPPNFSIMYHIQSIDGYDPLYLRRYGEFITAMNRGQGNITPPFNFFRIIAFERYDVPFVDLLNVKYILAFRDYNYPSLKKVFQEGQTIVYENTNVLNRTFFVSQTKSFTDNQQTIKAMYANNFNDVEEATITDNSTDTNLNNDNLSVGSSNITTYAANKVVIQTENKGRGFLVLTDSYYPTWHATIDGKETKIYIADYAFRGVFIPSGAHIVEFYDTLF